MAGDASDLVNLGAGRSDAQDRVHVSVGQRAARVEHDAAGERGARGGAGVVPLREA